MQKLRLEDIGMQEFQLVITVRVRRISDVHARITVGIRNMIQMLAMCLSCRMGY